MNSFKVTGQFQIFVGSVIILIRISVRDADHRHSRNIGEHIRRKASACQRREAFSYYTFPLIPVSISETNSAGRRLRKRQQKKVRPCGVWPYERTLHYPFLFWKLMIKPDIPYSLCQLSSDLPLSAAPHDTRRSLLLQPGTERRTIHPHPAVSTERTPARTSEAAAGSGLPDGR